MKKGKTVNYYIKMLLMSAIMMSFTSCGTSSSSNRDKNFESYAINGDVNVLPRASSEAIFLHEDSPKEILLKGYDAYHDSLSYRILTTPKHGTLTGTVPALTYTPKENFFGSDSFTFVSHNAKGDSQIATISLIVANVNDAPTTQSQDITLYGDALSLMLLAEDIDGGKLSYTISKKPSHGELSGIAPNLMYTPTAGYKGRDSFTYITNDTKANSQETQVSISIKKSNHIPVAKAQDIALNEGDSSISIELQATDLDIDVENPTREQLSYIITKEPKYGKLQDFNKENGTLKYKAKNLYFHGDDSFEFTVTDGKNMAQPAKVMLHIKSVNNRPFASAQNILVVENNSTEFTLKGRDIDYDKLSFRVTKNPAHGTLSGTAPHLIYTPSKDYFGSDSFEFVSNDGSVDSASATVEVVVKKRVRFSSLGFTRQSAGDILISKDATKAFVAGGYGSVGEAFKIMDVSDSTKPSLISSVDWQGHAYSIAVSEDETTAYVTDDSNGLRIIDISDVDNPKELSLFEVKGASSIKISKDGNTAYLASRAGSSNAPSSLQIIDISDAKNPKLLSSFSSGWVHDIALSKDETKIYLSDYNSIKIIDVQDTRNPKLISTLQERRIGKILLSRDETKLYGFADGSFVVYDISDAIHIKKITLLKFTKDIYLRNMTLSADGNILFVAGYRGGIIAVDVNDYIKIGTYKTKKTADAISILNDTTLFIGDYNDGFEVLSVELP